MIRWIRLAAWLIPAAVFVHACGGDSRTDSTSGNTNWLKLCDQQADCGDGLSCLCNACQEICASNVDCDLAGLGSRCAVQPSSLSCGDASSSGEERVCVKGCDVNADCERDDLICRDEVCVPGVGSKARDAATNTTMSDGTVPPSHNPDSALQDGTADLPDGTPTMFDEGGDDATRCLNALTQPIGPPYADSVSCHPAVEVPDACFGYVPQAQERECATEGGFEGVYQPADLPCGSCEPGDACNLGVWAVCDCDGEGPRPISQDDFYFDPWICMCLDGSWSCWLNGISGSSCAHCAPDGGL